MAERAPQAKSLQRDDALAELTLRYFKGHGPATVQDFMWWSGLTGKEAKAGLEIAKSDLVREVLDGTVYWMGRGVGPAGNGAASCHLLPAYDEYLIAYRNRSAAIHPARLQEVISGDRDMLTATSVFNGYVAGVWRRTLERNAVRITPHPFLKLTSTEKRKLSDAAQRYGRFLGKRVVLS